MESILETKLQELKNLTIEIGDLGAIGSILGWDQATYMPTGGATARGRQIGLIQMLSHQRLTDPKLGKLLDDLRPYEESLPYDSDEAALIRVTRRNFERAVKVPTEFMYQMSMHLSDTYTAWVEARPANDFARLAPMLEKTLALSRQAAEYFAPYDHIADPLIDMSDYGMKTESVRALFAQLREQLVPMVQAISEQPIADDSILKQFYPVDQQRAFGEQVIRRYGFDFNRGRQDTTPHPFMTRFAADDVRITTRFSERDFGDAFFSTLHEAGHAFYELGIDPGYDATPLGGGTSAGVHESQSRLWENIVGRSRAFWEFFYPPLQAAFPDQLGKVSLDAFYRAINKVQRSLIRVDADEVTYNLHVMIRFELEAQLLEGTLAIRDLPEAWHARYQSDLGLRAPDDRDGVLQDVHWYGGLIGGAFQGYTLGNLLSAQFYQQALQAHPNIVEEIRCGEFKTLHHWLRDNLYVYGSKYTAPELIQKVTGGAITIEPYLAYLRAKYGELYSL